MQYCWQALNLEVKHETVLEYLLKDFTFKLVGPAAAIVPSLQATIRIKQAAFMVLDY